MLLLYIDKYEKAMKTTDTISVNPSKTTLGRANEEAVEKMIRSSVIDRNGNHIVADEVISIVFPGTKSGLEQLKSYVLPLRALFATLLIVSGLSFTQGNLLSIHSLGLGIAVMISGAFLAIGLLTRPIMVAAAVFFGIAGALQMRHGLPDLNVLSLMFGSLIFAALGSGKYSCDAMIRTALRRHCRNKELRNSEKSIGYKAFHYATKSL